MGDYDASEFTHTRTVLRINLMNLRLASARWADEPTVEHLLALWDNYECAVEAALADMQPDTTLRALVALLVVSE